MHQDSIKQQIVCNNFDHSMNKSKCCNCIQIPKKELTVNDDLTESDMTVAMMAKH